ncbi:MAG: prepilin-type N-terminal cleavage/methylation domain-containing protein [Verrucomicrobiales bacterium]|nr:prepilin-type N-terminal cleavage/methylation domain-containing protein [Verrucomicrobiales bacterium]
MKRIPSRSHLETGRRGFTLLEVMIACFVFFVVAFSVLQMMTAGLVGARSLQKNKVDPVAMLAAGVTSTNATFEPVAVSGDFGEDYPDFSYDYLPSQVASNGLWQIEFRVYPKDGGPSNPSKLTVFIYCPECRPDPNFGGM